MNLEKAVAQIVADIEKDYIEKMEDIYRLIQIALIEKKRDDGRRIVAIGFKENKIFFSEIDEKLNLMLIEKIHVNVMNFAEFIEAYQIFKM